MRRLTPLALLATAAPAHARDLTARGLADRAASLPPPCDTKTEDAQGAVHNRCRTCHTLPRAPNFTPAPDLQPDHAMPRPVLAPWANRFVDRRAAVAATDAEEIRDWGRSDNSPGADGRPGRRPGSIGTTDHSTFALPRKLSGPGAFRDGRYHRRRTGLSGVQSFATGRDATIPPQQPTVWRRGEQDTPTGFAEPADPWFDRRKRRARHAALARRARCLYQVRAQIAHRRGRCVMVRP